MANTSVTYSADGLTSDFTFSFPYLSTDHIEVYKNDSLMSPVTHYNLVGSSTVRFVTDPIVNDVILIKRNTDIDNRLVDYQSGAVLTEAELDLDSKQAFYLAQEVKEQYSDYVEAAILRIATALGVVETTPAAVEAALVQTILDNTLAAEIQARITDIDTNASAILSLSTTVQDWGIDILANETDISAIDVRVTAAEADILTNAGVASANASAITGIDVRVTSAEGTISTQASQITVLQSSVTTIGGDLDAAEVTILAHTSAINTNDSDITTLEAKYGVTLNVNGYITGFAQNNDGSTGSFQIMADQFYIVDPAAGGQNPQIPFSVVSGEVFMDNITIRSGTSGKRTEISSSNNELEFYGDRGDASVTLQATIGIKAEGSDNVVGYFGTTAAGQGNVALYGASNTDFGGMFVSVAERAIYAVSQGSGKAAINGVSAPASGVGIGVWGEGTYTAGAGVPTGIYGTATDGGYGVHGKHLTGTQTGYGVRAEHAVTYGIPLFIVPDITNSDPQTTSIVEGSIWMGNGGNRAYIYRDDDWADLGKPKPVNFSTGGVTEEFVAGGLTIPPECMKVTIMFYAVSTNGSSDPIIQLAYGATPTWVTSGYSMCQVDETSGAAASSTIGLPLAATWASGRYITGHLTLMRRPGYNIWFMSGSATSSNGANAFVYSGYVSLSGELSNIRFNTTNGTDSYNAGQVVAYAERF